MYSFYVRFTWKAQLQKKDWHRERFSILQVTPQIATMATTEVIQSQDSNASFMFPTWVHGPKDLNYSTILSQVIIRELY